MKSYSSLYVNTKLVEDWREKIVQNFTVGAILSDLSKVLDCILQDLLMAKVADALALVFSFLKNLKFHESVSCQQH